MPAHLRPPERPLARPLGALTVAVVIALIVFAGFGGPPKEESTTRLVQPAADATTEPTVLGEVIEPTTLPDAPAAAAAGFTTTSAAQTGATAAPPPPTSPDPTLGPPVSITAPPTTRPLPPPTTDPPPAPECSDGFDNDVPEDGLIDDADPGCHSDGDTNNPESYDPTDGDETDPV